MRITATRREELTRDREDQILDAAVGLWIERGFDSVTVEMIARAAGVGKGTVYLYFPTKQDILDAAIARHSIRPEIETVLAAFAARPVADIVPVLIRAVLAALRTRLAIVKLLVRELIVRPAQARTFIERVVLPINHALADQLATDPAVRAGGVDPFIAARALVGMVIMFVFTQDVFGGAQLRPISDDDLVTAIAQLFVHGVAPGKEAA